MACVVVPPARPRHHHAAGQAAARGFLAQQLGAGALPQLVGGQAFAGLMKRQAVDGGDAVGAGLGRRGCFGSEDGDHERYSFRPARAGR
jgi:hypothetical protein